MSSQDTKISNGLCVACQKEEAIKRCTGCLKVGIETFYCNRECQVTHWKTHKPVCGSCENLNLKELKKLTQRMQKSTLCQNCFKSSFEIGSMRVCSNCKVTTYCSRKCQVAHWAKHKSACEENCGQRLYMDSFMDSRERDIRELLWKWVQNAHVFMMCAKINALTVNDLKQQPPTKAVVIHVEFDYNAQTFLPVGDEPQAISTDILRMQKGLNANIDRLYKRYKNCEGKKSESEQSYTQFFLVTCKELQGKFVIESLFDLTESQMEMKKDTSLKENINYYCREVKLKSHLFQGWDAIRASNLEHQTDYLKSSQAYLRFAQNALHPFSNKGRHLTHGIVIHMRMGKEIGQIAELEKYEVTTLRAIIGMTTVRHGGKSRKKIDLMLQNEIDILKSPKLLWQSRQQNPNSIMMVICFVNMETETMFTADSGICELPMVLKGKKVKTCNRDAKKYFKELQSMVKEMPSDLVEKVSL